MADVHGPLFNGEAERLTVAMCADIERDIADVGADMVRAALGQVLRHPTGYYESHITAQPDGGDTAVTDQGVIYGPWLEGVGSRNRTTRFKGYATFRRVRQALDTRAEMIAEPTARHYVGRMG